VLDFGTQLLRLGKIAGILSLRKDLMHLTVILFYFILFLHDSVKMKTNLNFCKKITLK